MSGYLVNFMIYTLAMVGIIFLALFIYKKTAVMPGGKSRSKFLGVEDVMSLTPRKNLYVVRAGNERFLIASDMERTTLISKLENNTQEENIPVINTPSVDDLPDITNYSARKKAVMKEMAKKINF
mgnify:CR=1 FL=1